MKFYVMGGHRLGFAGVSFVKVAFIPLTNGIKFWLLFFWYPNFYQCVKLCDILLKSLKNIYLLILKPCSMYSWVWRLHYWQMQHKFAKLHWNYVNIGKYQQLLSIFQWPELWRSCTAVLIFQKRPILTSKKMFSDFISYCEASISILFTITYMFRVHSL